MPKFQLPLSYMYKLENAGEIAIDSRLFEDMLLQLRAGEERPDCREKGGILGGTGDPEITHFFFDSLGLTNRSSYHPDADSLEQVIRLWRSRNIRFLGIIHTHTREDALSLSKKDLQFVRVMLVLNPGMDLIMGVLAKGGKLILYKFEQDFVPWAEKEGLI